MSTGGRSHVLLQQSLFGGTEVVQVYRRGRTRLACATEDQAERLALAIAHREHAVLAAPSEVPVTSTCPACGFEGPTLEEFGVRRLDGELQSQSWCRRCRAGPGASAEGSAGRRP